MLSQLLPASLGQCPSLSLLPPASAPFLKESNKSCPKLNYPGIFQRTTSSLRRILALAIMKITFFTLLHIIMKCIASWEWFINKRTVLACEGQIEGACICFLSHTSCLCAGQVLAQDKWQGWHRPLTLDFARSLGLKPCDLLQCQMPLGILGEGKNWLTHLFWVAHNCRY